MVWRIRPANCTRRREATAQRTQEIGETKMAGRKRAEHANGEMQAQPADQKTVRRHNMGIVLNNIAKGGRRSRARVSTETGLNPSTVSSLIADLIERGLLRDVGAEQDGSVGRPGRALELDPDGGAAIGIEISDDGIGVLALDLAGTPRYRAFFSQPNERMQPRDVLRQLAGVTREALGYFKSTGVNTVCTMALPGLIGDGGELLEAPNIGWHDVPVLDLWREFSAPLPLATENEARLAAYAEMTGGVARELRSFAYISGGTGLGGGIVLDRKIFRGAHGFAGEFGHITIERTGGSPADPRGTVQTLAGEGALAELAHLARDHSSSGDPNWVGRQIAQRAAKGDQAALDALTKVAHALGVGIAVIANLFDMEAIVLGGYFSHLSEWLRAPIQEELTTRVISQRWAHSPVLFSTMGREAAVRGAAAWSLDTILDQAGHNEDLPSARRLAEHFV
jgi:predicted NBD/HSP70 family sugar kinase